MSWENELEDVEPKNSDWESELEDISKPKTPRSALGGKLDQVDVPKVGAYPQIPVVTPMIEKAYTGGEAVVRKLAGDDRNLWMIYENLMAKLKAGKAKRDTGEMLLSEGGGAVMTPASATAPVKFGGKALQALSGGRVIAPAKVGAGLMEKTARGTGNIAALGAGQATASYLDELARGSDPQIAKDRALMSAYITGGLGAGTGLLGAAGQTTRAFTGISPELEEAYRGVDLATRKTFPNVKTTKEGIEQLKFDVEKPIAQTREKLKGIDKEIKTKSFEKQEISDAIKKASKERSLVDLDPETADRIVRARQNLMAQIKAGSSEGYKVLDKANVEIDIRPFMGQLSGGLNKNKIEGVLLDESAANTAQSVLNKFREINQAAESTKISAVDAKRFIQYLDSLTQQAYDAKASGVYSPQAIDVIVGLRKSLRKRLGKEVPEYDRVMEPVARQTELQTKLEKLLGRDKEKYSSRVLGMTSRKSSEYAPVEQRLGQLQAETGEQFMGDVSRVREARRPDFIDPKEAQKQGLVEDIRGLQKQQFNLGETEQKFAGMQPQTLVQNIMTGGKNPFEGRKLQELGDFAGQDFRKRAEDLSAMNAMNQPFQIGTTQTALGGMLGVAIGSLVGQPTIGAIAGGSASTVAARKGRLGMRFWFDTLDKLGQNPQYAKFAQVVKAVINKSPSTAAAMIAAQARNDQALREYLENEARSNNTSD